MQQTKSPIPNIIMVNKNVLTQKTQNMSITVDSKPIVFLQMRDYSCNRYL